MKRNIDLLRLLLLRQAGATDVDLAIFTEEQITYNSYLLIKLGFVKGFYVKDAHGIDSTVINGLTQHGQDFLEFARNDADWKKLKAVADATNKQPASRLRQVFRLLFAR